VRSRTYEIISAGRPGSVLRPVFDDYEIGVGSCLRTVHADVPDPAAFCGLMQRTADLRVQLTNVLLVPSC
jgi:hypothetical protein